MALLRHVQHLVHNNESAPTSILYPYGSLHFVLTGEAEDPEPLTEGHLVVTHNDADYEDATAGINLPKDILGQVVEQGAEGVSILFSNGAEAIITDWADVVAVVDYGAFIDAREEEFLVLEKLVAARDTAKR